MRNRNRHCRGGLQLPSPLSHLPTPCSLLPHLHQCCLVGRQGPWLALEHGSAARVEEAEEGGDPCRLGGSMGVEHHLGGKRDGREWHEMRV